jgi:hypothetical protein
MPNGSLSIFVICIFFFFLAAIALFPGDEAFALF